MRRGITNFFRYARLRHDAYLAKCDKVPRGTQSQDPILNKYRFTNVFRELDKTTVWFREHFREEWRNDSRVLIGTVVFRLLNRIEVGEAIFNQSDMFDVNAFNEFLHSGGDVRVLRKAIRANCGDGPYVTGAYIISSPKGYSKLDGVLRVIKDFYRNSGWRHWVDQDPRGNECSLEAAWEWLRDQPYLGPFHAYEIVTDLRHTTLLDQAPDIMTWANPGPGARRGLNRVYGRDKRDKSASRDQMIEGMCELLAHSRDRDLWPSYWPEWEMREVEHTLCEFDKYERVRLGEGRPRGVYQ